LAGILRSHAAESSPQFFSFYRNYLLFLKWHKRKVEVASQPLRLTVFTLMFEFNNIRQML